MKKTIKKDKKKPALPDKPGVYIFSNVQGDIIYIGKAVNLKKRAGSYFRSSSKDMKTEIMSKQIADTDYIITKNEFEAFLLENSLIKEHKPRYNILLKDDKSYPFIEIASGDKYPGVYITRNTKNKKSSYFGPYPAAEVKKAVKLIYKIYKVRQCKYDIKKPFARPCVYYDTGECSAPCARLISEEAYTSSVQAVKKFLKGKYKPVLEMLQKQMALYSFRKEYEKAAEARDAAAAVKEIMKGQKVITAGEKNIDAAGYIYREGTYCFCVLNIRSGRLISKKTDVFTGMPVQQNVLEMYLYQLYLKNIYVPEEVIIRCGNADKKLMCGILSQRGAVPVFKKRDPLLDMLEENLEESIKFSVQNAKLNSRKAGRNREQVKKLQESLELKRPPSVIDAIDISHFSGDDMVGSCVVFREGEPDKKNYRRYRIKNAAKPDDYAAIKEVVSRRYSRMISEKRILPGLILIDGGRGQVNSAKEELEKLDIYPDVIGLAKKEEKVYRPYEKNPVNMDISALFLLQRLRDEAHRFANAYRFSLANKKMKASVFDNIPGIGEKTKQLIYSGFSDIKELKREIRKESKKVSFLTKKQKKNILAKFKG